QRRRETIMRLHILALGLVSLPGLFLHADEPLKKDKTAKDYLERGNLMMARGDADQALADFTEAIKRDAELAAAYRGRALLHTQKREADKALADFEEAIQIEPQNAGFRVDRAMLHMRQGDDEKALTDFDEAIKINPKDARTYTLRA